MLFVSGRERIARSMERAFWRTCGAGRFDPVTRPS